MSKNKDSDSEVDIYGDLPNFSSDNTISELENAKKDLESELKAIKLKLAEIQVENNKLKKENEALSINISSLYKTAACEIKRKDQMIQELRKEKDSILFRRHRNEAQKRSRKHDAQPEEICITDDHNSPVENEVCLVEENRQQDYTSYHYDGMQHDEDYGEEDVIETFPEEDDDCIVQSTPQEVPDTIFSRRKAQQLKILMKKSDNLKDARSEDPEIIIVDSKKTQSTIFDRRKNQKQKLYSEHQDIPKATIEVPTSCSSVLDDHATSAKEKSSASTSGTKNTEISNKKTGLSASKHLDTAKKTVEVHTSGSSALDDHATSAKEKSSTSTPGTKSTEISDKYTGLSDSKHLDTVKKTVEVHTSCSSALDEHTTSAKEKSRTSISGTKNTEISHKKTEHSSSKHLDTVKKTGDASIKTSYKAIELPSASVKTTQSSRKEDVKVSKSKSSHKPKEHSDVDKSRREKHSRVSSKDRRPSSDAHAHRKSSSSSKSKSTHNSSHRSSAKNCLSPRSPKGRSIRETSVSRALKSLRSRSQIKDLDYKSSRSVKERARHKEVDSEDSKKGNSQGHKKTDHRIVKSQVSPEVFPEKSQPKVVPVPDTQLTENVCSKSKLVPGTAKAVNIADSEISSSTNSDIHMKTKSCSERQNSSQPEGLAKINEKEQYSMQADNAPICNDVSYKESIMEMQTDKTSHKEDSRTLVVSNMPHEDITEVQGNCDVLRQEGNSGVPINSDKLHKEASNKTSDILQKDSISKVSQHSDSSENKNISETAMDIDLPVKKHTEMPVANGQVTKNTPVDDDEQHKEDVTERFTGGEVLQNKDVNNEATDVVSMHDEDDIKGGLISTKRSNKVSDDNNIKLKTTLANLESEISSNNVASNELKTQDESTEPTRDNTEAVQDSATTDLEEVAVPVNSAQDPVTTNKEEITAAANSDLSSNMHAEENTTPCSSHEEKRPLEIAATKDRRKYCSIEASKNSVEEPLEKSIDSSENSQIISSNATTKDRSKYCSIETSKNSVEEPLEKSIDSSENSQIISSNAATKDRSKYCSIETSKNSVEEPLEKSTDSSENSQIISSTLQADVGERDTILEVSKETSAHKDSIPALQEPVSQSPVVEKEHLESVNQPLPNPDESLSAMPTFKKGNISFTVVNEPGFFRRRKFKRISSDNSNNSSISDITTKAADEHLHNEKLSSTKRPYEHLDLESSVSPPAKKQALAVPQKGHLHPSAIKHNSEDSCQSHLEICSTQTDEKNTSVTETNTSNDQNNTSDLEEGEIEDSDNDEKASEGNKKLNKDKQGTKVLKSVIHTASDIRKEPRKYLELSRKARESRRKSHSSHLQEVARGNHDKRYLPKKLFSHCKRRSPSELLIKDRNFKVGTKEKDQSSSSRSTSSEASRNTSERLKGRKTNENIDKIKSSCISEEKIETTDKAKALSTSVSVLQNIHVNKPKDLSAWTRLGNFSHNEVREAQSSSKESNVALNGDNRDAFKTPATSSQPVTKYIIKRRKVCNLQDNVSVPVVNISPPKPFTTATNVSLGENLKSLHFKTAVTSVAEPPKEINFSTHSRETLISKTYASSKSGASQTCSRISADTKGLVRSRKTLTYQVSSDSTTSSSSSSSEYENNSDETWNPKRRRKRKGRKNPKTEVTKSKTNEVSL